MLSDDRKMRSCMMAACAGQRRNLVHKFPADSKRAEEWRQIINHPALDGLSLDTIRKRMFVCTNHFRRQDYKHSESRSLNKTAVPSLLLEPFQTPDNDNDCQKSTSSSTNEEILQYSIIDEHSPDMLRFEIKFDSVELLDPSDLNDCEVASTTEHVDDKDIQDEDGTLSILEPNPHRANTYTLLNAPTSSSRKRRFDRDVVNLKDDHTSTEDQHPHDESEQEEMVVMSLSSEIFSKLENQLLQQQQLQTSQIIVQSNNCIIEDQTGYDSSQHDKLDEIHDIISIDDPMVLDVSIVSEEMSSVHDSSGTMATTTIEENGDEFIVVRLQDGRQLPEICSFWLRDHCRCPDCYDTKTCQRKQNVLDIPVDIKPISVQEVNNQLLVTWIDNHTSTYDITNLEKMLSDGPEVNVSTTLWSKSQIAQHPYARVTLNDYLCDDAVAKSIVESLVQFGVAFIEKVPASVQSTEMAVKRLFAIQKTFFGEMWSFSDNMDHADTAYSKSYLGAHTDNTYFNDAAGLQVLHCIQHNGTGGESLLLDGFHALEGLLQKHPDSYNRLCEVDVPAEYIEEKQHHTYCAPIIRLDSQTGAPEQIRFNLYDRSPMNTLPQRQMRQFYKDLRHLTAEIQSPDNEWWFKLNPGTVVIFDNWRVLHGRAAYTGRRQIAGCYVSRTEFQSVARTLGIIS